METKDSQDLIQGLLDLVLEFTATANSARNYREHSSNLTGSIKYLAPLFKELRESGASLPTAAKLPLRTLHIVLCRAKDLLQECRDGSQFVLILYKTSSKFRELIGDLSQALDALPLDSLGISPEVHEKIELVRAQLKEAKGQVDSEEEQLLRSLLQKLSSDQVGVQCEAAKELRALARVSPESRLSIAESGAIPILVSLLSTPDLKTQEHAVSALLNLSIKDSNKQAIVRAGAIDPIVDVLKHGKTEARENAAAALFSLSVSDQLRITVGNSEAIPALVVLLKEGQSRGKKDAAAALFTLSIYNENKAKAVRAGIVPILRDLLVDPSWGMVDEALAILAVLSTHPVGRQDIGQTDLIGILVELIRDGSPRIKENGAAVLLELCRSDEIHTATARQLGAAVPLTELLQTGMTSRAKEKARKILDILDKEDYVFLRTFPVN